MNSTKLFRACAFAIAMGAAALLTAQVQTHVPDVVPGAKPFTVERIKIHGAALGDDLEAPVDPSAPMRWAGAEIDPADPALPEGAAPLAMHVQAPKELARRLAQIGVV